MRCFCSNACFYRTFQSQWCIFSGEQGWNRLVVFQWASFHWWEFLHRIQLRLLLSFFCFSWNRFRCLCWARYLWTFTSFCLLDWDHIRPWVFGASSLQLPSRAWSCLEVAVKGIWHKPSCKYHVHGGSRIDGWLRLIFLTDPRQTHLWDHLSALYENKQLNKMESDCTHSWSFKRKNHDPSGTTCCYRNSS